MPAERKIFYSKRHERRKKANDLLNYNVIYKSEDSAKEISHTNTLNICEAVQENANLKFLQSRLSIIDKKVTLPQTLITCDNDLETKNSDTEKFKKTKPNISLLNKISFYCKNKDDESKQKNRFY